jgi:hypothetical protein
LKQVRRHLTYANVMSSIAVFLVLGGATAFAATKIGANQLKANSVKTGKIAKEAVTAGKLKKGAVTETKLADGAVTTNKIADNSVTTGKIVNDAVTAEKIASNAITEAKIANGAVSASKLGVITVQTETAPVPKESSNSANVDCPAGQRAISGGGAWNDFLKGLSFLSTRPIKSSADTAQMADGEVAGGWRSSGTNENTTTGTSIVVWVLCIQ